MDKEGTIYNTVDDVPEKHKERLQAHFFAPSQEEAESMHLERW